jgi:hypothetical protein
LVDERVIRTEDALNFAKTRNMAFMETSAVEGTNCMRALQIIMQGIFYYDGVMSKDESTLF